MDIQTRNLLFGALAGASAGGAAGFTWGRRHSLYGGALNTLARTVRASRKSTEALTRRLSDQPAKHVAMEGSLSSTGPGLMMSTPHVSRLKATAHAAGGGMALSFTGKEVANIVAMTGATATAKRLRKSLPTEMYMGMELSPLPVTAGIVVNKSNINRTANQLAGIEDSIKAHRRDVLAAGRA